MKDYFFYAPLLAQPLRYMLFAGLAYLLFYVLLRNQWASRKNQPKYPEKAKIFNEIKYSLLTSFIFGAVAICMIWCSFQGITRMYFDIEIWGYTYFLISILMMIIFHDTYFYWTHRFMHHPKIYRKVHFIHHTSHNPTPWASFAFHPLEALIEIGFAPILMFLVPTHWLAWVFFLFYMMFMNVSGHLGYEYYPTYFVKHKILKWHTTPTHHNMHHQFVHKNYGLYFNFWDRIMRTNHEKYEEYFERTTGKDRKK